MLRTLIIIILLLLVIGLYYKTEETKQVIGFVIKKLPKVSETLEEIKGLRHNASQVELPSEVSINESNINTTPPQ